VPRLWYVRKQGQVRGPFPAGAVIQDRLIGRISASEELSPDREEWRVFDAWPELGSALASTASATGTVEPEWLRERARARLRWADERSAPDRRSGESTAQAAERRENERRAQRAAAGGKRTWPRPRARFGNERAVLKIVAILAIAAGLIALLTWLYGPVNPVPVRIR